jgi:hypothetical protein
MNRRHLAIGCIAGLIFVLAGCGGGGQTITETVSSDTTEADTTEAASTLVPVEALTPKGVERCLEQKERATVLSSEDLNPGEPINAHGVFAVSSESGARIGIVLTLKPFITKRLSRELAEEALYAVNVTPNEEAVVLLDGKATSEDEALASECSEPR